MLKALIKCVKQKKTIRKRLNKILKKQLYREIQKKKTK